MRLFPEGRTVLLPFDGFEVAADVLRALGNSGEQIEQTLDRTRFLGTFTTGPVP
jgi:hypothetical protein